MRIEACGLSQRISLAQSISASVKTDRYFSPLNFIGNELDPDPPRVVDQSVDSN